MCIRSTETQTFTGLFSKNLRTSVYFITSNYHGDVNTLCYSQEDDIAILLQNRKCFLSISNHKSGEHPKIHVPPMAQNTTPYSVNLK